MQRFDHEDSVECIRSSYRELHLFPARPRSRPSAVVSRDGAHLGEELTASEKVVSPNPTTVAVERRAGECRAWMAASGDVPPDATVTAQEESDEGDRGSGEHRYQCGYERVARRSRSRRRVRWRSRRRRSRMRSRPSRSSPGRRMGRRIYRPSSQRTRRSRSRCCSRTHGIPARARVIRDWCWISPQHASRRLSRAD